MATSPTDIQNIYNDLETALSSTGPRTIPEKIQVWSIGSGNLVCVGGHNLEIQALLCRGTGWVWLYTTRALSHETRQQRLRDDILPVMT